MLGKIILSVLAVFTMMSFAAGHSTKKIIMKSISYDPKKLEIKVGDAVEWENKSYTDHSATSEDAGGCDTGLIARGKTTKKVEFNKAGVYKYHCSMHGKSMSGEITVTE
jgi:plastocyanin